MAKNKKRGLFTNRNTQKMLDQLHGPKKKAAAKKPAAKRKGSARKK